MARLALRLLLLLSIVFSMTGLVGILLKKQSLVGKRRISHVLEP